MNGSWFSISGHKYTILDPDYLSPFRASEDEWESGEDSCKPMHLDVKVDLQALLYESPSTIASQINHQLNTSDVYGDSNVNPTVKDKYLQDERLPTLSGNLLQVKAVNGTNGIGDRKLWGNKAVQTKTMTHQLPFSADIIPIGTTERKMMEWMELECCSWQTTLSANNTTWACILCRSQLPTWHNIIGILQILTGLSPKPPVSTQSGHMFTASLVLPTTPQSNNTVVIYLKDGVIMIRSFST